MWTICGANRGYHSRFGLTWSEEGQAIQYDGLRGMFLVRLEDLWKSDSRLRYLSIHISIKNDEKLLPSDFRNADE